MHTVQYLLCHVVLLGLVVSHVASGAGSRGHVAHPGALSRAHRGAVQPVARILAHVALVADRGGGAVGGHPHVAPQRCPS